MSSNNDNHLDETSDHSVLDEVIAEYIRACESGQPPDREKLLAAHPDLADELREFFANRDQMDQVARPMRDLVTRVLNVRCPHCHNPIELLDRATLDDISCPACGSSFSLVAEQTESQYANGSKTLGQFELLAQVGIGAFGSVWKARDTKLDRTVAIKIPRRGQLNGSETEMFLRDARATAQLKHPNIVGVHEVGRQNGTIYIVSDFIEGATLKQWLDTKRLTPREAAELCVKIAKALHHAHEAGVIHRDLKPGNIMMDTDDQPHLVDFGLAKREAGEITMTVEGQILGTPAYMPPEQARGDGYRVDRRADIYSLGVILFELLTGELPFRGEKQMLIVQILKDDPPSARKLDSAVPRDLDTICLKCMEKEPAKRYESGLDLAHDLERFAYGEPIHARPISRTERAVRWCKRNPGVSFLSAATSMLLIAIAFVTTLAYFREAVLRDEAEDAQARAANALSDFKNEREYSGKLSTDIAKLERQRGELDKRVQATQAVLDQGEQKQFETFLQLARRAWEADDVELADYYLNQCPERFRDDVWQKLKREYYPPVVKFEGKQCVAISPDGTLIAAASAGGKVKVWEIETRRELHAFDGIVSGVDAVRFSPDGNLLAGCGDVQAVLWDLGSGQHLHTFEGHSRGVTDVDFSPDGTRLASASFGRAYPEHHGKVIVWNLKTFQQERTFPSTRYAVFSHDGRYLATANKVWDLSQLSSPQQAAVIPFRSVCRPAFHPQQNVLAIAKNAHPEVVELRRIPSNEVVQRLPLPQGWSTSCLAFSHDAKRLVSARWRNNDYSTAPRTFRTVIWNLMTQEVERILPWHLSQVTGVEFQPGKPMLATAEKDVVKLWDITAPHNPTQVILDDIAALQVGRYDWPQWGGSRARVNTPFGKNIPSDWDVGTLDRKTGKWVGSRARVNTPFGKNIPSDWDVGTLDRKTGDWVGSRNVKWVANLGMQTYGNPVVANGRIFVGTNNGNGYLKRYPYQIDLGVLLCLEEATGKFLWQHSNEKLATGRVHDWEMQGVCSTPMVDGDRLWYVSNRGEVVCLDTEGYYDGEDDGPVKSDWEQLFNFDITRVPFHWRHVSVPSVIRRAFSKCKIVIPADAILRFNRDERRREIGVWQRSQTSNRTSWHGLYSLQFTDEQINVFEINKDNSTADAELFSLSNQWLPVLMDGQLNDFIRGLIEDRGIALPNDYQLTVDEDGITWSISAVVNGVERKIRLRQNGTNRLAADILLTIHDRHEADVVWRFNMMTELGVSQHNMANCSVLTADGMLFVCTSNGLDESHINIPAPEAPSFLAMDRETGKVIWTDNSPGKNILHAQWGSPSYGVFDGQPQVIFPGGDGWVYSFDPKGDGKGGSKLLWKFDGNPKQSKWILGGRGTRNNIIAFPAIYDGLVYIVMGQDPEHGEGVGHLWCIDPTKYTDGSDVSAELALDGDGNVIPHRRIQAVYPWSSGFKGGPELAEGLEEGKVSKELRKRIESLGTRLSEAPKVIKQQRNRAWWRRSGWRITSNTDSSASFLVIVHVNKDGERTGVTVEKATGERAAPNPKSAVDWHYSQQDRNGDGKFSFDETFHRSLSIPAIKDNILYIPDFSGLFHCLNAKTGKVYWTYDMFAQCWGSPLLVDDKVYIADEDGEITIFPHTVSSRPALEARATEDGRVEYILASGLQTGDPIAVINMESSVYMTPIVANNVLYIASRSYLFAIQNESEQVRAPSESSSQPKKE